MGRSTTQLRYHVSVLYSNVLFLRFSEGCQTIHFTFNHQSDSHIHSFKVLEFDIFLHLNIFDIFESFTVFQFDIFTSARARACTCACAFAFSSTSFTFTLTSFEFYIFT